MIKLLNIIPKEIWQDISPVLDKYAGSLHFHKVMINGKGWRKAAEALLLDTEANLILMHPRIWLQLIWSTEVAM